MLPGIPLTITFIRLIFPPLLLEVTTKLDLPAHILSLTQRRKGAVFCLDYNALRLCGLA
jgi:hypothetical protein